MGILSGIKSALSSKPSLEKYERKTAGLPPKEAAPKWVEFAQQHQEDNPKNAMYGYRRAAALFKETGDTDNFVTHSLNYAKAAERVPRYSIAGDGYRVAAEKMPEEAEKHYAKAGENYHNAGEKAKDDRRTTRACDMYAAAADAFERAKEYQKAIDDYLSSTKISEKKKHLIRVARDYGKVAENYLRLEDYQKSAEYFLKHAEAETDRAHVEYSDGFSRAGQAFVRAGDVEKGADAFLKDAEYANEPAYGYRNAAECYQKMGNNEQSLEYYMKEVEDDIEKNRTFVAWEILEHLKDIAEDTSEIEEKMKSIEVSNEFEDASKAFSDTLKRELEQKGIDN